MVNGRSECSQQALSWPPWRARSYRSCMSTGAIGKFRPRANGGRARRARGWIVFAAPAFKGPPLRRGRPETRDDASPAPGQVGRNFRAGICALRIDDRRFGGNSFRSSIPSGAGLTLRTRTRPVGPETISYRAAEPGITRAGSRLIDRCLRCAPGVGARRRAARCLEPGRRPGRHAADQGRYQDTA